MNISVNVPDDSQLATDIAAWPVGGSYNLVVDKTGDTSFDGISGSPSEEEPEEKSEIDEADSGPPMPKMGMKGHGKMPPAIAVIIGGGGKGK